MEPALKAPGEFAPANDNARAYIERDELGNVIRVVPATGGRNPLRCAPYAVTPPRTQSEPSVATLRTRLVARQTIGDGWDGRRLLSWPTAERLLKRERIDDLRHLYEWRALIDLATLQPANDNIARLGAAEGEVDDRPPEEVIDQADSLMVFRPSIGDIKAAIQWGDHGRPTVLTEDEKSGALRKQLGGLVFDGDNKLESFRREPDGRVQLAKPEVMYRHRAERLPLPHIVSSAGMWTLQGHIEAREELRILNERLGAVHGEVLEMACGPSTARAIGEMLGKAGKTAERAGLKATDDALAALTSLKRD